MVVYDGSSSKGRTTDFDSVNRGSNPCDPTNTSERYMKVTGILRNAKKVHLYDDSFVVVGELYGDILNRFDDGEKIKTSRIVKETNEYIITRNSHYKVQWADDKIYEWNEVA